MIALSAAEIAVIVGSGPATKQVPDVAGQTADEAQKNLTVYGFSKFAQAAVDSPRPAGITRSASGPRPKTTRLPSGIAITRPAGVVTCAVTGAESSAITVLPAGCPATPAWSAPAAAPSPEVACGSGHSRSAVTRNASRNSGMAAGAWTRLAFSNRGGAGNAPGGDRSHLRSNQGSLRDGPLSARRGQGGTCRSGVARLAPAMDAASLWAARTPRTRLNHSPGELFFLIVFLTATARRRASGRGN